MLIFKKIIYALWAATAGVLAVSTFMPSSPVYGSWWFAALLALVGAALAAAIIFTPMRRHAGSACLHASLLLMLLGGLCTRLWQHRGAIVLGPGQTAAAYCDSDGADHALPRPVTLISFEADCYPGSMAPRSYTSLLAIGPDTASVAVNRPATLGSLRLYQSGFTPDGCTVIGVTSDPAGTLLSMAGYLLFAIGGLAVLLSPRSRFRTLLRGLGLLALLAAPASQAAAPTPASYEASAQVLYQGRAAPLSTPATHFLLRVSGRRSIGGEKAEATVISMLEHPAKWSSKRYILVKDRTLRDSLGLPGRYASLNDLFDSQGAYRLRQWYDADAGRPINKAILDLDERVELIINLHEGTLFEPLPAGMQPLPRWRVAAENTYNRVAFTFIFFIAAVSVGAIAMLLPMRLRTARVTRRIMAAAMALLAMWQAAGCTLAAIAMGRLPLSSTAETLAFASLLLMLMGLFIGRRQPLLGPAAAIVAGFASLAASLASAGASSGPLAPALASPWLGIHVSVIMAAYAMLAFAAINQFVGMRSEKASALTLALLHPAVYLLGLGIFTGAVWAEQAWGRYWAWDPKETWALITLMAAAVPLHGQWQRHPRRLTAYMALCVALMLMTYFGANRLGGLHAYS